MGMDVKATYAPTELWEIEVTQNLEGGGVRFGIESIYFTPASNRGLVCNHNYHQRLPPAAPTLLNILINRIIDSSH